MTPREHLKQGWLKRGLESAKLESKSFPKHRRQALKTDQEFLLRPAKKKSK